MKKLLLCLIFSIALPVNAGWIDKQGNEIPDSDNMKSTCSFVAQQVITDDEKTTLKNWGTPSQSVYFPT